MAESNGRNITDSRYYCHECKMETILNLQGDYACNRCRGTFIEEIEPLPGPATQAEPPISSYDPDRDVDETEDPPSDQLDPPPNPFTRYYQRTPNGHMIVSMSRGNAAQTPQRLFVQDIGAPFGQRTANGPAHPLEQLINQLFGNLGGNLFGGGGVHGNPGDYVWGAGGLDAIITQLLNNVEGSGPPPAEESTINRLPSTSITQQQVDNNVECSVCFDEFSLNEEVKVLPCKHHYHQQCIEPWLKMHGTCPVCRKDLSGEDTSTQEYIPDIPGEISDMDTTQNQPETSTTGLNTNQEQSVGSGLSGPADNSRNAEASRDFLDDELE